jgi:hypothetical protein
LSRCRSPFSASAACSASIAGVLFGILTVKPQLGLLLPIIRLLERRWATIASTVMTIAFLFVVTAMLFGWDVWISEVRALPYWLPANLLAVNLLAWR